MGMLAPVVFTCGWLILGATYRGYNPFQEAISRLARIGAPTHRTMTAVFYVYGVMIILFALSLLSTHRKVSYALLVNGIASILVGLTPLREGHSAALHGIFASVVYISLTAIPVLGSRADYAIVQASAMRWTSAVLVGVFFVCSSLIDAKHGTFQRAGVTLGNFYVFSLALQAFSTRAP